MRENEQPRFVALIEGLGAIFCRELDRAVIDGYWEALRDLTIMDVGAAIAAATKQCEHFPTPAVLRRLAGVAAHTGAIQAWPEVMRLASRSSSDHSDPIAAEAIRLMGGGKRLGQMPQSELEVWGRKQFEDFYLEIASSKKVLELASRNPETKMKLEGVGETVEMLMSRMRDGET